LAAFIAAGLLLILAVFGIIHSRRVSPSEELLGTSTPQDVATTG
jgi:hypothetical protein